jgi:hypothetical protein
MKAPPGDSFLESLMDTNLYSMGAYFADEHPDLVDEVIEPSRSRRPASPATPRPTASRPRSASRPS